MSERFISFSPAPVGDWVAIYATSDATDPFRLEPIIGWVVQTDAEDEVIIVPVIGGESITLADDAIGVYRRRDLNQPAIRKSIMDLCSMMRRAMTLRDQSAAVSS